MDSLEPYRSFIFKKLGKLWRDYKYYLHQQVAACETVEEMEANRSKGVSETQWAALCGYWDSEAGKKRCTTNAENRGKQLIGRHTAGTKSVANRDYEENLCSPDGSVKPRYQRFIDIHTRKDGTPVDAASAEKIAQIRELESQATVESLRTGPNDIMHKYLDQIDMEGCEGWDSEPHRQKRQALLYGFFSVL